MEISIDTVGCGGAGTTTRLQQRRDIAAKLKTSLGQLVKQFHTIRRAIVHPGVPWYAKFCCGCALAYVVSPIQLIPNFIPVIGQLDDVLVITLSIRLLKRCVPPAVLDECENKSRSAIQSVIPVSPTTGADPDLLL